MPPQLPVLIKKTPADFIELIRLCESGSPKQRHGSTETAYGFGELSTKG